MENNEIKIVFEFMEVKHIYIVCLTNKCTFLRM